MAPSRHTTSPPSDGLPGLTQEQRSPTGRPTGKTNRKLSLASFLQSLLRDNLTPAVDGLLSTDHQFRSIVIVLADVFKHFLARSPAKVKTTFPRRSVRAGIIDGHFITHGIHVRAREPLDHMKLLGVRQALSVDPKFFVESYSIHDQRVSLPAADGVSVVAGREI